MSIKILLWVQIQIILLCNRFYLLFYYAAFFISVEWIPSLFSTFTISASFCFSAPMLCILLLSSFFSLLLTVILNFFFRSLSLSSLLRGLKSSKISFAFLLLSSETLTYLLMIFFSLWRPGCPLSSFLPVSLMISPLLFSTLVKGLSYVSFSLAQSLLFYSTSCYHSQQGKILLSDDYGTFLLNLQAQGFFAITIVVFLIKFI